MRAPQGLLLTPHTGRCLWSVTCPGQLLLIILCGYIAPFLGKCEISLQLSRKPILLLLELIRQYHQR